ncbi:MAG: hypothetical protein JO166_13835 [Deltaproteobacteria bacterium]|nr:hypothetical protein [Deltaproteobacteria bacterium]
MAIERTTYPHTGIYQRKSSKVALRADEQTSRDLTELLRGGHQDDVLGLDAMESEGIEFLKRYFMTVMGGSNESFRRESIERLVQEHVDQMRETIASELRNDPSTEYKRGLTRKLGKVESAADACEILDLIDGVRSLLRTQPILQSAIGTGLLLGKARERFRVRRYERNAFTGSKALAGASAGGKAAKKSALRRYEQIVFDFERSGLGQREFEKRFGVPRKSLHRAIKAVGSSPAK